MSQKPNDVHGISTICQTEPSVLVALYKTGNRSETAAYQIFREMLKLEIMIASYGCKRQKIFLVYGLARLSQFVPDSVKIRLKSSITN